MDSIGIPALTPGRAPATSCTDGLRVFRKRHKNTLSWPFSVLNCCLDAGACPYNSASSCTKGYFYVVPLGFVVVLWSRVM